MSEALKISIETNPDIFLNAETTKVPDRAKLISWIRAVYVDFQGGVDLTNDQVRLLTSTLKSPDIPRVGRGLLERRFNVLALHVKDAQGRIIGITTNPEGLMLLVNGAEDGSLEPEHVKQYLSSLNPTDAQVNEIYKAFTLADHKAKAGAAAATTPKPRKPREPKVKVEPPQETLPPAASPDEGKAYATPDAGKMSSGSVGKQEGKFHLVDGEVVEGMMAKLDTLGERVDQIETFLRSFSRSMVGSVDGLSSQLSQFTGHVVGLRGEVAHLSKNLKAVHTNQAGFSAYMDPMADIAPFLEPSGPEEETVKAAPVEEIPANVVPLFKPDDAEEQDDEPEEEEEEPIDADGPTVYTEEELKALTLPDLLPIAAKLGIVYATTPKWARSVIIDILKKQG